MYKTDRSRYENTKRGIRYESVGPSFRMETDVPVLPSLPIPHLYFVQNFSNLVTFVCLKEKSLKIK